MPKLLITFVHRRNTSVFLSSFPISVDAYVLTCVLTATFPGRSVHSPVKDVSS